mmetsp:Transcript_29382/g.65897  ORF Transcript_29382/g.65897 Transcript_29382/m.65897 type:complete len:117 (-) Transcript_29382:1057-1407(-)
MRMSDRRRAEIAQRPASVRVDDVARAARRKRKRGSSSSGDRADGDESGDEDEDEDGEENDLQLGERAEMSWEERAHGTDWNDYTGSIKLMFKPWSRRSKRGTFSYLMNSSKRKAHR